MPLKGYHNPTERGSTFSCDIARARISRRGPTTGAKVGLNESSTRRRASSNTVADRIRFKRRAAYMSRRTPCTSSERRRIRGDAQAFRSRARMRLSAGGTLCSAQGGTLGCARPASPHRAGSRRRPGPRACGRPLLLHQPALHPDFAWQVHDYVVRCDQNALRVNVAVPTGWRGSVGAMDQHSTDFVASRSLDAGSALVVSFHRAGKPSARTYFHLRCLPSDFPSY